MKRHHLEYLCYRARGLGFSVAALFIYKREAGEQVHPQASRCRTSPDLMAADNVDLAYARHHRFFVNLFSPSEECVPLFSASGLCLFGVWVTYGRGEFPEKSVWNHHIRIVEWLKILCYSSMISKHSFINCPAILDKLSTKDRRIRRGRSINPKCLYCHELKMLKSRDRVFTFVLLHRINGTKSDADLFLRISSRLLSRNF
ncbi:hypothetical protein DKX38_002639 [Salix brachista]|uniref:Uncharacterized protein n=1 Tax=Salix brachista TaxID=2182728 RepID=A0A5N5NRF4_9ROSI|nr:hypothetical protein DKX38_002639 [Salix brachista]